MKIKNFHIPGSLGQCVMAPPEKVNGDFPYLLYNLGGIIFNGLFSILSLVLVFVIPINSVEECTRRPTIQTRRIQDIASTSTFQRNTISPFLTNF